MDPEEYQLRWQTFLIDGFDDWLPAAYVAAAQSPKIKPREFLKGMISDFYFPEGVQQTTDQLVDAIEQILVHRMNATIRDPKTGEIIGKARDNQKKKPGPPPKDDPVRRRKAERRKKK